MKLYCMSEEELQIAKMKNISSIKIYDLLVPFSGGEDTLKLGTKDFSSNEKKSFLGIMVFCDNQMPINLCARDKLFEKFNLKLLNQYNIEKDVREIRLDSNTKAYLESSLKTDKKEVPTIIEESVSYEESLMRDGSKKFKKFESVFKYNLEKLLEYLEKNIDISQIKGSWNTLNVGDKLSIVIYESNENSIYFELLGLLDTVEFVKGKIDISSNSIKFFLESSDNSICMYSSFENKENGIERKISVNSNDKLQYYDTGLYDEKVNEEDLIKINSLLNNELHNNEVKNVYKLPWNGYFTNNINGLDGSYCYVELRDDYILYTSYDETTYDGEYGYSIRTSGGREKTEIFRVDDSNTGIIETHFSKVENALSIYKSKLSEKYFYFIGNFDSFENPKQLLVEPIKEDISLGYELFNIGKRLKK